MTAHDHAWLHATLVLTLENGAGLWLRLTYSPPDPDVDDRPGRDGRLVVATLGGDGHDADGQPFPDPALEEVACVPVELFLDRVRAFVEVARMGACAALLVAVQADPAAVEHGRTAFTCFREDTVLCFGTDDGSYADFRYDDRVLSQLADFCDQVERVRALVACSLAC